MNYSKCQMLGKNRRTSYLPSKKSAGKIMINGVIAILSSDTTQIWAKVPSKELSDVLADAFKDKLKADKYVGVLWLQQKLFNLVSEQFIRF